MARHPTTNKRNESHLFCSKNQAKFEFCFLSLLNCFVQSGRGRASVVCWLYAWFVAKEASVVVGESEANKRKTNVRSSSPEFCLVSAKGFSKETSGYRQSRHCVSEPKRRHWRASVGSGSSNATDERARFLFFVLYNVKKHCHTIHRIPHLSLTHRCGQCNVTIMTSISPSTNFRSQTK